MKKQPTRLQINGKPQPYQGDAEQPLLWYLRDELGLTGTKFGCGIGMCGACTVHVDGVAVKSCSVPAATLGGKRITTIEGLAGRDGALHAVQRAWMEANVPQCGYCQTGQMMAAAALALTVGFRVGAAENHASFQPNAWLRIDGSGAVTVLISKTEIGQGAS